MVLQKNSGPEGKSQVWFLDLKYTSMWSWAGTKPADTHATRACHALEGSRLSETSKWRQKDLEARRSRSGPCWPCSRPGLLRHLDTGEWLLHRGPTARSHWLLGCQLLKFLHIWGQVYLNDLMSYHLDFVPFEKHGSPLSSHIFKTRRGTAGFPVWWPAPRASLPKPPPRDVGLLHYPCQRYQIINSKRILPHSFPSFGICFG